MVVIIKKRICTYIAGLGVIGLTCVLIGGIVFSKMREIIGERVVQTLVLKEGSSVYNNWISPIVPIYMKIYLFNVTNPERVRRNGATPRVQELGPYTYKEQRLKEVVRWNKESSTVTYREKRVYIFQPDLSIGSEEDVIVAVNMPMVKNESDEGLMSVYTGEKNMNRYLSYYSWNEEKSLPFWKNKYCDMINGTDGRGFSPFIKRSDTLYIFIPDICRSVPLKYENDVDVKGILAYRFTLPQSAFQNAVSNADNKCFFKGANYRSNNGVFPVSVCQKGRPVYVSLPHFYQADERLTKRVKGLTPQKEKHETFIDVEPTIGTAIRASGKLQFNFEIIRNPYISFLNSVVDTMMPVFWLEEAAEISESAKEQFHAQVTTPMAIGKAVLIAVMVLGVVWIFISMAIILWNIWKKSKPQDNKVTDMNVIKDPTNKSETSVKRY